MKPSVLLLTAVALFAHSALAQQPPKPLLLAGARVLDAAGDALLEGHELLVVDGRIAAVCIADLAVVRGDPLRDPSVLRKALVVVKEGRIVLDRR